MPFSLLLIALAFPVHAYNSPSALQDTWFHPPDHPIHALFRRQSEPVSNIPTTACVDGFPPLPDPPAPIDVSATPQGWIDYFNHHCKGNIPNIPKTTMSATGNPTYPRGYDPSSVQVCSATYRGCRMEGDIWDAPSSYMALSFDDGPWLGSARLYDFLKTQNATATHFFIGSHIQANPDMFLAAFNTLRDDIAVHTYTHPYLTTLANDVIFAELAFTMQIIHDCTGGRVPKYWRPPYGDSDLRVNGVAKCLDLTTILWNKDSNDWRLINNSTNHSQVNTNIQNALKGPKSPGLILLEHELSDQTAQAFIDNYPLIAQNGWNTISAAQMDGTPYQNAQGSNGPVTSADIFLNDAISSPPSNSASHSTASSESSSTAVSNRSSALNNGVGSTSASEVLALSVTLLLCITTWLF